MPIRRTAERAGVFTPSEIALLGRVFDRLKVNAQSDHEREALASRIIANFMAGIEDEDNLVLASKRPLGR
ncbi:hypothetical protein NKH16_11365 [Mesorhizobium sp. M1307]|uniref:hypothetical protein n=1 Tax=Mesorhizobium sp. M1307 TaxID=2957079 RepID=UPI00333CDCF8